MTTTISSREFNQDVSRAKRCALDGPVIITDRGKPAYEFEAPRWGGGVVRAPDLA